MYIKIYQNLIFNHDSEQKVKGHMQVPPLNHGRNSAEVMLSAAHIAWGWISLETRTACGTLTVCSFKMSLNLSPRSHFNTFWKLMEIEKLTCPAQSTGQTLHSTRNRPPSVHSSVRHRPSGPSVHTTTWASSNLYANRCALFCFFKCSCNFLQVNSTSKHSREERHPTSAEMMFVSSLLTLWSIQAARGLASEEGKACLWQIPKAAVGSQDSRSSS